MKTALLLFLAVPLSGGNWLRIQSVPSEVFTDGPESEARQVAARLQEMRRILGKQWAESPLPVRVLVLSSSADYAALSPSETARAFFQSGPERDYIITHSGQSDTLRAVSHEYVHVVLHHASVSLPLWVEEGLADFFSTATVKKGIAELGAPIDGHVSVLQRAAWLDAPTLEAVNRKSPEYNDRRGVTVFYAESWALVHMLMSDPAGSGGVPSFLNRLAQGEDQDTAFEASFQRSLKDALMALHSYVEQGRFAPLEMELSGPAVGIPGAESVSGPEGRLVAAEVATLGGRPEVAERMYKQIAAAYPASPAAASGLAALAMQSSDYQAARTHLARAIELGAHDASTYFEYAMLTRDTGGSHDVVAAYLKKAAAANPHHPETQFLLGQIAASEGRWDEAIGHYRKATEVLPRQSSFWHALAMACLTSGKRDDAREAARKALDSAVLPHEREMAEAVLKLVSSQPAAPAARTGGAVIVPESWKARHPDHRLSGRLTEVECRPEGALFHIAGTDGTTVILTAKRPNEIELRNSPAVNQGFSCGPQKNVNVTVEYSADNDLITLEFIR
jgi:Flp pilus assembly protein TadD